MAEAKRSQIYLVRHGETDWNKLKLLQGSTDNSLNDTGRQQAQDIVAVLNLPRIDRVFASPLLRAQQTAEIIAAHHQVVVETEPGLTERSYGDYEGGHTDIFDEVRRLLKSMTDAQRLVYRHKNEESEQIVLDRLVPAIKSIALKTIGQTVVGVSHGSALRSLVHHQFGKAGMKSPYLQNTAFLHLESDGQTLELKGMHGVIDRK